MFKLSRRADYATRLLLELAVAEGRQLTAQQAARRTGVPLPVLRKSLAPLVEAGFINTQTGPGGGLTLVCDPSQVTMLDVVETLEGPVCLNNCLLRPHECPRDHICPAHNMWGRLQFLIISELRAATLEALASEYLALRHLPAPKRQSVHDLPLMASQNLELSSTTFRKD